MLYGSAQNMGSIGSIFQNTIERLQSQIAAAQAETARIAGDYAPGTLPPIVATTPPAVTTPVIISTTGQAIPAPAAASVGSTIAGNTYSIAGHAINKNYIYAGAAGLALLLILGRKGVSSGKHKK